MKKTHRYVGHVHSQNTSVADYRWQLKKGTKQHSKKKIWQDSMQLRQADTVEYDSQDKG